MPTPPVIDVDALLEPIAGPDPSGKNLAYEPLYDEIRDARRSDEDLAQGAWQRDVKSADWELVVDLAVDALRDRTKDLQIAAWLTEALGRLHSFAGIRDGLRLLGGIQSLFWDTYFPRIEDGDVESRFGPFLFLNEPFKGLPALIRGLPVTIGIADQRYPFFKYKESRDTDNAIRQNSSREKALRAEGKIVSKEFDDAVAQTPKAFYATLVDDLRGCIEAFKAFDGETDARFGRDAPSLMNVSKILDECLRWAEPVLAEKRRLDPDPIAEPEPGEVPQEPGDDGGDGGGAAPADGSALVVGPVGVPRRKIIVANGPDLEAPDFGRLLMDFEDRARLLADAGLKLKENRKKYADLLVELKTLDDEYESISRYLSRNQEGYQLLARLSKIPGVEPPA